MQRVVGAEDAIQLKAVEPVLTAAVQMKPGD